VKKRHTHTNHSQREKQREKSDHEKSFRDEKIYHPIRNNRNQKSRQRGINLAKNDPFGQKQNPHVINRQMHSVVDISIKYGNKYDTIGSGFILDGYVITCSHVVEGFKTFFITTCDGDKIRGFLICRWSGLDFACIKLDGKTDSLKNIKYDSKRKVQISDPVWTIGSPQGFSFSYSPGVVQHPSRTPEDCRLNRITHYFGQDVKTYFQIAIPTHFGSSGSPLFDSSGRVIGMITHKMEDSVISLAIPIGQILAAWTKYKNENHL